MATAVHISASNDIRGRRPAIGRALQELETRLNALSEDELQAVVEGISRALELPPAEPSDHLSELLGEPVPEAQRAKDEVEVFVRSFARRRQLLADALTAPQVARLLNTTRQTPHDRVKSGSLLAVMDRGALRFPPWQFDPEGDDGVITGLPAVIRALDVSPLAKICWLTHPNAMLDSERPLDLIPKGQLARVLKLAEGVGVS